MSPADTIFWESETLCGILRSIFRTRRKIKKPILTRNYLVRKIGSNGRILRLEIQCEVRWRIPLLSIPTVFPFSFLPWKGEFLDFDLNLLTSTVHSKSGSIKVRFAFS